MKIGSSAVHPSLKFNLVLLVVAAIVIELFAVVSTPFLENIARAEVLQKARIMMEAAAGIRTYTSTEIAPLLNTKLDDGKFHPQTGPAYAASKNFALLATKFTDYAYREAALNPINPANRALDWEADLISDFRKNPDKGELITERETHGGRVLNLSHPIVSKGPCLACHGTLEQAPRPMILAYGVRAGFGWKVNEIVGAQIVSVPMAVALEQATRIRNLFIGVLAGVFLLLIGLVNVLPLLMTALSRADLQPAEAPRPWPMAQSVKAFGYGLFAAGIVVLIVAYVVIYAKEGVAGLERVFDPFAPMNYVSIAAVVPGMLTVWLASFLRGQARGRALDRLS